MFFEVLRRYVHQGKSEFRQKEEFSCYRACLISGEEYEDFALNIGGFVQMEGFLSTSLDQEVALGYLHEEKDK